MKQLINENDKHKMNWVEGATEWGTTKLPEGIKCTYTQEKANGLIKEKYIFKNITEHEIFTSKTSVGIYTPFNDSYDSAGICLTNRCNAHIYCGGEISYALALRMGGEPPHLGMVLTKGSLCGYSVERDLSKSSNDRGDFILHPSPVHLLPDEEFAIEWTLFFVENRTDFYEKLSKYSSFIKADAEKFVIPAGETVKVSFKAYNTIENADAYCDASRIDFKIEGDTLKIETASLCVGEHAFNAKINGKVAACVVLIIPPLMQLAKSRAAFIISKQQLIRPESHLHGAYLVYDNEEEHMAFEMTFDYNSARERVGMGLFLIKYAQLTGDKSVVDSIKLYLEYVERELFDSATGEVFNAYKRDNSYRRLYNDVWFSRMFLEAYKLFGNRDYLIYAYKAMLVYFKDGGETFHPIMMPITMLCEELKKAELLAELENILRLFKANAENICKIGSDFPAYETNFEQGVVCSAADCLMQYAYIFDNKEYYHEAKKQMDMLLLFNSHQPDYHLYETAIRHWDGYWFGKRKLFGDTFPHYWSGLTGMAGLSEYQITHDEDLKKMIYNSIMGTLSLISPDGRASCAYVYPLTVNGVASRGADAYANDQDWAMYFALCLQEFFE